MEDIPDIIIVHALVAALAIVIGPIQFLSRKGSPGHRATGYVWVILMVATSLTSFWITGLNGARFSFIHILSVVTLVSITLAIIAARRRNMRSHRSAMIWTYVGLVTAFVFTLMPGRLTHEIVFGF